MNEIIRHFVSGVAFYEIFGQSGDSSEETLDEEDLEMMALDKMEHVPWLVSISIIGATVFCGGSLFAAAEDWSNLDGV